MAPEFFIDLEKNGYSYEIDYYQVGILLFELLLGKVPFGYEPKEADILKGI